MTRNERRRSCCQLMRLLSHKTTPDADELLSVVYYLLLQDRVDEASALFDKIDAQNLKTEIQYDYFRCYLDFYREQPAAARKLALGYKDYPVDRWRKAFVDVTGLEKLLVTVKVAGSSCTW